jgi:hypothetical protein
MGEMKMKHQFKYTLALMLSAALILLSGCSQTPISETEAPVNPDTAAQPAEALFPAAEPTATAFHSPIEDFEYTVVAGHPNNTWHTYMSTDHISITAYNGPGGHVVIPRMIGGLPVAVIEHFVFAKCPYTTSVTVPDTVRWIEGDAFWLSEYHESSQLKSITFEGDAPGWGSIYNPAPGTTVYYREGTRDWGAVELFIARRRISVERGHDGGFAPELHMIPAPEGTYTPPPYPWPVVPPPYSPVEDFKFDIDEDLVRITEYIGPGGHVVIPSMIGGLSVTRIGPLAFCWNESIVSIYIPDAVNRIGDSAFANCPALTYISFPDPTHIGMHGTILIDSSPIVEIRG